ncbi:right-handed parallel beta-helix repeat-containing protein, partial [Methylicorpusculum sp.]|uniref:right-handed parallel beta-helix repeat-containing protein n=1 Tax=Methylicorpusculum sp. TaxID=2713644 RepID=UPI002ABB287F
HSTGTAITIKNSNNVLLDHLDINNIGGKGVEIINGQNVQLSNSKIHHTGAHGVVVSGGDKKTLLASGHVINNNHIHHMAETILTYSSGIDVNGVGTKITHNLLEQGAGTAILLAGNDHLIEKNEIHHFCLQASDCGAVYTGRDWSARGNIIRYNFIHDIIGFGMNSVDVANNQVVYQSPNYVMGVYLDDGASGFDVSGNIFENAGSRSIHINGGRDNKIYNNYFKTNDFAIWLAQQSPAYWDQNQKKLDDSPYKTPLWEQKYPELAVPMHNKTWPEGNRIERNIIVTSKPDGNSFRYNVPSNSTIIANNIIWSTTGKLTIDYKIIELNKQLGKASWSQWTAEGIER